MTTFDKRERGFEAKFIHDEELKFKATARCNKMLGKLGRGAARADGRCRHCLRERTRDCEFGEPEQRRDLAQGIKRPGGKGHLRAAGRFEDG